MPDGATLSDGYGSIKMFSIKDNNGSLEINRRGALFARYVYRGLKKPYLGPILAADGQSFTRADEHNPEHPHQRSVFIGHGEVILEGHPPIDTWNEPQNGAGIIEHVRFEVLERERFAAQNVWKSLDEGTPYLDERREYVFHDFCGAVEIDNTITLTATYGKVTLGPTKEAGPFAIRVADDLRGDRGGRIENAEGLVGEHECWGKVSPWVKYSGTLNGKPVSIKVIDDPSNVDYPTAWHVRDYGLFAANNFYFKGSRDIEQGQSITWKFKIIFSDIG